MPQLARRDDRTILARIAICCDLLFRKSLLSQDSYTILARLQGSKQIPEEERSAYLKLDFLQQISNLDPVIYFLRLKGTTIRIQQVIADPVTPGAAKAKLTSVASEIAKITRYPDITAESNSGMKRRLT